MALRFIRQPSETPNVGNADDARMIRYAYGGYDGYVKGKGAELSHTISGTNFRINSGVVVLQGYETEVDANGWTMSVDSVSTRRYYSVYYEVNLATQTVKIDSTYSTASYPDIPPSDDLTTNSTGTARMLLYRFSALSGVISDVNKAVQVNKYIPERFSDLLLAIYPVGAIYLSVNNVNPKMFLGGEWAPFAAGRTLVGVDTSQSEFNAVEKAGGAKTHTLSVNEMPKHRHELSYTGHFDFWVKKEESNTRKSQSGSDPDMILLDQDPIDYHTSYEGSGGAHNNLQPYITCYFWKRTA